MTRLTTLADAEAVADRAAVEIVRALQGARREHGVAHLALSGGTTPARTYELLASAMADWDGVSVWFADERCVGPHDEQSNFRLAHEALLGPAGIPPEQVHRMEGELGPEQGAERYARALAEHVAVRDGDLPVLDVIVLGIGPDGHIASLFPGAPTLDAGEHALCLGVYNSPKPPPERITLSLAVLRAARGCVLLATSAEKSDAISAMLGDPTKHVPASLLRRGRLSVIVDDAAAPPAPRR
ncbi:MAG: 6-phosphogluconolactonase [Solirubrobacteraceae bacterium]